MLVTDWGGNNDSVESLKCFNQLEMPGTQIVQKEIIKAIEKGELMKKY